MHVLSVYAHSDSQSFGAALHNRALAFFEQAKHQVVVSDLYGEGFQPIANAVDFQSSAGAHKNYIQDQQHAVETGGFAPQLQQEIDRLRVAELILFEFPLWWSAPPAILSGWIEKVFAYGVAWDGEHRYDSGLLRGKKALVICAGGDPEQYYTNDGQHGATVKQHLYPLLHSTLAQVGMDVLDPFIALNITASSKDERQAAIDRLQPYLQSVVDNPSYIYKQS